MQGLPRHVRYMILREWAQTNLVEAKLAFPKLRGKLVVPDRVKKVLSRRQRIRYLGFDASIEWHSPTSHFWLNRIFGPPESKVRAWPEYYGTQPRYLHKEIMVHDSPTSEYSVDVIYDRLAGAKRRRW